MFPLQYDNLIFIIKLAPQFNTALCMVLSNCTWLCSCIKSTETCYKNELYVYYTYDLFISINSYLYDDFSWTLLYFLCIIMPVPGEFIFYESTCMCLSFLILSYLCWAKLCWDKSNSLTSNEIYMIFGTLINFAYSFIKYRCREFAHI